MPSKNMTIRKTISKTEYKYKIITAGFQLALPVGMPVSITFAYCSKEYMAMMHSITVGRIDGLTEFYRDSNLQPGDEITIFYDDLTKNINITLCNEEMQKAALKEFEDVEFELDDSWFDETQEVGGTPTGTELNVNGCEVEVTGLGIADSNSWKNLPYRSCLPPESSGEFAAASDDNYVVIASEHKEWTGVYDAQVTGRIHIFDKSTKECYYFTPVLDKKTEEQFGCNNMYKCEIMNGFFYWTDGRKAYKTSLTDGSTNAVYQLKGYSKNCWLKDIWKATDPFGINRIFGIYVKYNNDGFVRQVVVDLENGVEMANISKKYGERVVGIGDYKLLLDSYDVYDISDNSVVPIFEYAFESPYYDKIRENLREREKEASYSGQFMHNVFAVDLHTHTVVIRDYPELKLKNYRGGDLVAIGKDGVRRIPNVYRGRECADMRGHCCEVYRDCRGHEVVIDCSYDFLYRNPDGTVNKLFRTHGSCVPETYKVADNHTAVVKIGEGTIAIVDFAENMRYTIEL